MVAAEAAVTKVFFIAHPTLGMTFHCLFLPQRFGFFLLGAPLERILATVICLQQSATIGVAATFWPGDHHDWLAR